MSRRAQPRRAARPGQADTELGQVMDELKQLREKVRVLASSAERADMGRRAEPVQVNVQGEDLAPMRSPQAGAPPVVMLIAQPLQVAIPNPAIPTIGTFPAPVPSSSLPLMDIVPDNVRLDIMRGLDVALTAMWPSTAQYSSARTSPLCRHKVWVWQRPHVLDRGM